MIPGGSFDAWKELLIPLAKDFGIDPFYILYSEGQLKVSTRLIYRKYNRPVVYLPYKHQGYRVSVEFTEFYG